MSKKQNKLNVDTETALAIFDMEMESYFQEGPHQIEGLPTILDIAINMYTAAYEKTNDLISAFRKLKPEDNEELKRTLWDEIKLRTGIFLDLPEICEVFIEYVEDMRRMLNPAPQLH